MSYANNLNMIKFYEIPLLNKERDFLIQQCYPIYQLLIEINRKQAYKV